MNRTAVLLAAALSAACGKMGPPLPPLIRIPVRPDNLIAERRGDTVQLSFVVPAANEDGSRPANVERVEVYALTAAPWATDEDVRKLGTHVATIEVNPPPDPEAEQEAPAAARPAAPALQSGVDQGATAHVTERLTPDTLKVVELPSIGLKPGMSATGNLTSTGAGAGGEAATTAAALAPRRIYLAVPIGSRGRTGGASRRAQVPLTPAPPMPSSPSLTYDAEGIRLAWQMESGDALAFHVYSVSTATPGGPIIETRLTKQPVTEPNFIDRRIEWGAERCYQVRSVRAEGNLSQESEAALPACVTLRDTFPPNAPTGLTAVASVGAISLIWDASTEADLGGYVVLRGQTAEGPFIEATPQPIQETSFRDVVPSGTRVWYAVRAVDKLGNVSAPSAVIEETSR